MAQPGAWTGRHELLVTEPEAPARAYAAPVLEALSGGWDVLLHCSSEVSEHVVEAVGGRTAHLHLLGPGPGSRPAAVLDDLTVLADLHHADGLRLQSVREVGQRPPEQWWDWARVEAAYAVALPAVWHVCGYDLSGLDTAQRADLRATHPWVREHGVARPGRGVDPGFAELLAARTTAFVPAGPDLDVHLGLAAEVGEQVAGHLAACGVRGEQVADLVLAARAVAAEALGRTGDRVHLAVQVRPERCVVVLGDRDGGPPGPFDGLRPDDGATGLFLAHCATDVRPVDWAGHRALHLSLPRDDARAAQPPRPRSSARSWGVP